MNGFVGELQKLDLCWKKSAKSLGLVAMVACVAHFLAFGFVAFDVGLFAPYLTIIAALVAFGALLGAHPIFNSYVAIIPHSKLAANFSPLMLGGVIFLIAEHLNMQAINVVFYATLPATMIALNFSKNSPQKTYLQGLNLAIIICAAIILIAFGRYAVDAVNVIYGNKAVMIFALAIIGCYVAMAFVGAENYHNFLPIILLLWLLFVENVAPEIAALWAIALASLIILTADALKSSFVQRKRLKQPKIATELVRGVMALQNYAIIAAARIAFFAYHGVVIWLSFEALKGLNAGVSLDWTAQPNALKLAICFAPLLFLPSQTPIFWRYFLLINLYEMLRINLDLPPIKIELMIAYIAIAASFARQKPWKNEYLLPILLPLLIYHNDALILLGVADFELIIFTITISALATMALIACLKQYWLAPNQKIETVALGFAAIILLVPDLFMNYVSNYAFNYLPINLKMAAKYVVYFPVLCMVLIVYLRQLARRNYNAE